MILKPIDLCVVTVAFLCAYYVRESVLLDTLKWQVVLLLGAGFTIGLFYRSNGRTPFTEDRLLFIMWFYLMFSGMLAFWVADGWDLFLAWPVYGVVGTSVFVAAYLGWRMPKRFGSTSKYR